jgi:hypothetical protein
MNCRKAKRGSVMTLILIAVFLLMIIGVGVIGLDFHGRMMAVRSCADIAARCAADAAIADAVFQMNEKLKVKPWDESSLPVASNIGLPNCDATCDYTVSNVGGNYVIQGTGRSGHSIRSVEGILRVQSMFDYALFAKDSIELKNSATIDWVNNEPNDWPMQVGTNSINDGAITLMSSTTINGDVVVGVGGDPASVINAHSGVSITGDTYAMFSKAIFPSVIVPAWLASMASGGDIKNTTTISVSGKYTSINLKNSDKLTITEPVVLYITGNITLGNSAQIDIGGPLDTDNDASLIIYLAGNFESKNSSQINNLTADAKRFTLYCLDSCTQLVVKNGCNFYGAIYAPNASIDLDNSGNIYGSIVGRTFVLRNSATFFYDAALRDRTVNDDAVRFVINRWSEQ